MLAIDVEFLTGRYVATAYSSRVDSEWPPHPARLFSALIATHAAEPDVSLDERGILEWIETLGPPEIWASPASPRDIVTVFVPVNDVALTDVDMPAADCDETRVAVVRARAKGDSKELKRSEKALEKAEKKLKAAISRQTEVPDGRINPALGARVLPEHRIRQPRTFPSVTPDDPRVTFVWPHAKVSDGQLPTLAGLLGRLVRLGHSSSLVAARVNTDFVAETDPRSAWRPATGGEETLRVVQPGQLEALERSFAQHQETEPRVMPARFVGYTRQRVSASAVEIGRAHV